MASTQQDYQDRAETLAELAHESHFESRGGVWTIRDFKCLCYFNNNPYVVDPDRRNRLLGDFREELFRWEVTELAYATYPKEGESAGYTFAMLFDAHPKQKEDFVAILSELGLPCSTGNMSLCDSDDAEKVHVLIGGIPFDAIEIDTDWGIPDGYGMVALTQHVGNYMDAPAHFDPDPANRYHPAGSYVHVRWEDELHPSTGRRQGTAVTDPRVRPFGSRGV